jgi:hypothetical protein
VFITKAAILFHLGTLFLGFDRAAVDLHGFYHGSRQFLIFFSEMPHTPLVVLFKSSRVITTIRIQERYRNELA